MATPEEVDVWVGLDVGKTDHFADVLDDAALEELLDAAAGHGTPALVIDQPGSIAQLAIAVAARRGVAVADVPGLVMRRAADLYPGEAKTDRRDAFVLAEVARTQRRRVHWPDASDELLEELKVVGGFDSDLAADPTWTSNRLRDALTVVSPTLERALGPKLDHPGVRRLLAAYPTPTALREAGAEQIRATVSEASPRMADKLTVAVEQALDAQTVTLPGEAALGRSRRPSSPASSTAQSTAAKPSPPSPPQDTGIAGVLRPQTRPRQTPQRRGHVPGPPPLRASPSPCPAPAPPTSPLPAAPRRPRTRPGRLTTLTET